MCLETASQNMLYALLSPCNVFRQLDPCHLHGADWGTGLSHSRQVVVSLYVRVRDVQLLMRPWDIAVAAFVGASPWRLC